MRCSVVQEGLRIELQASPTGRRPKHADEIMSLRWFHAMSTRTGPWGREWVSLCGLRAPLYHQNEQEEVAGKRGSHDWMDGASLIFFAPLHHFTCLCGYFLMLEMVSISSLNLWGDSALLAPRPSVCVWCFTVCVDQLV